MNNLLMVKWIARIIGKNPVAQYEKFQKYDLVEENGHLYQFIMDPADNRCYGIVINVNRKFEYIPLEDLTVLPNQ